MSWACRIKRLVEGREERVRTFGPGDLSPVRPAPRAYLEAKRAKADLPAGEYVVEVAPIHPEAGTPFHSWEDGVLSARRRVVLKGDLVLRAIYKAPWGLTAMTVLPCHGRADITATVLPCYAEVSGT